jgi:chemotaxis protein CheD
VAAEYRVVVAGLGERRVSADPGDLLVAYGLGSCVGLVIWGWQGGRFVAGLAHVVMPDSRGQAGAEPAKYADTAVADLAAALRRAGCRPDGLQAVMAGGAAMFRGASGALGEIGAANAARLRAELERAGIPLRAAAVGGERGRTLRVWVGGQRITVSAVGGAEVALWPTGAAGG